MNATKLVLGVTAITLCAAASAMPHQEARTGAHAWQTSYDLYRRAVLGDTSVRVVEAGTSGAAVKHVPGGYARYLMHNGSSDAEARRVAGMAPDGEYMVACESPLLDSYERYQHTVLGRSPEDIARSRASASRRTQRPAR